ncbi:DNA methylase - type 1 restriction-modification system [Thermococcus sp. 2319x1]|uniref:restriction endonuclease subunit S n=1 Tax=Thermococcus sp. 2319x1 TaxID=1674923 RepID=UPI00073A9A70|nr:restriction endonuclease subunit S [Thermococcus sp. 2319x1]ALV62988.1 DNA methylase - type 1 restriction-modification system [Thermococcus sp. 2319x1]
MPVSEIRFSDILIDRRFEAEYYHPIRMKTIEALRNSGFELTLLGKIANIRRELIDPQDYYSKRFIYVELKNVPFGGFGTIFTKVLGKELDSTKLRFKKTDILFSKIRTYLNKVVLIPEYIEEGICSTEFVVLNIFKSEYDPYALWIYLISKYTYNQVRFIGIGSTRPRANPADILNIRVPIFPKDFQQKIGDITRDAFKKIQIADQKYQQAEEKLYELLGISKEEIEKLEAEKAYEVNFKEVRQAFRFDAEYYHPKYLGVIELLKKVPFEVKPLKEIAKIKHKKVNPEDKLYRTKKVKYIEIGGIDTAFGEIIKYKEDYGWKLPSGDKYLVKEKDILYSKVRPYRKGIGFVTDEFKGSLVTQGFTVVRCKDESIIPEFLFVYLRSDIGNLPVLRNMSGSTYPTIKDEDVGKILIPKVPKDEQQEIAELVREYFKLRKESRQLVQRAIREVEEAIENASPRE